MALNPNLVTETVATKEAGWKSEVRALRDAFNNLVVTLAAQSTPALITTQGVYSKGSSDAKCWKNTAGVMSVKGVATAISAAETAFTHAGHDVAQNKEAWFVLTVQSDGTTKTITKAADQTIGTHVLPAVPSNETVLCWLKMITQTAGGTWDANTDNLAVGTKIASLDFYPVTALAVVNL